MLLLCFETSAKACSAALHDGERLLGESYQNTGLTHSQTLMVMAEDLLKQCGKTAADVTALAVARRSRQLHGGPHRRQRRQGLCLGGGPTLLRGVHSGGHGPVSGGVSGLCAGGHGRPAEPGLCGAVPCGLWKIHKSDGGFCHFSRGFKGSSTKMLRTDFSGWRREYFVL